MTIKDAAESGTVGRIMTRLGMVLLALVVASCSKSGSEDPAANFSSDPQTAKIEHVIHDYLISHPEIIDEARKEGMQLAMAPVIKEHRNEIETPFAGAWAGARDGDVVLIEFFDYACPFCKASNTDVKRLLDEDKNLKVVWREFPVLGVNSISAAEASLAAAKQGRFREFFDRQFAQSQLTPESLAKTQQAVGVKPIQSVEFEQEIRKNRELARVLEINGTPTFIVGDRLLSGAVGYDELKAAIAKARQKKA